VNSTSKSFQLWNLKMLNLSSMIHFIYIYIYIYICFLPCLCSEEQQQDNHTISSAKEASGYLVIGKNKSWYLSQRWGPINPNSIWPNFRPRNIIN
jgi:hypothetical protein